jgi:hypothetical protein
LDPVPSFEPSREGFLPLKHEGDRRYQCVPWQDEGINRIVITADIVEKLIGELFFHPEEGEKDGDVEPETKPEAMKLFKQQDDGIYLVSVMKPLRFWLTTDHTSVGLSFRQTAAVNAHHCNRSKIAKLSGLNDRMVGQFVRVIVGVSLQIISKVLPSPSVWAFSLAGDTSNHFGVSLFDEGIRVCVDGLRYNLHLMIVPFFERHTAINYVKLIETILDALVNVHVYMCEDTT